MDESPDHPPTDDDTTPPPAPMDHRLIPLATGTLTAPPPTPMDIAKYDLQSEYDELGLIEDDDDDDDDQQQNSEKKISSTATHATPQRKRTRPSDDNLPP